MNSKAIADALAARFVGITSTSGEAIAIGPTASLPNGITQGPALLVYPPTAVTDVLVSRIRSDELDFPIRLLRDPIDYPTRSDALYAWWDPLRDRVEANMDLDLAYVAWARVLSMHAELNGEKYLDGKTFDVVEQIVRVHLNEIVTTMAI